MAERLSNCLDHLPGEIEMAVKTRPSCPWTKRPRELYCSLAFESLFQLFRIGGRFVISVIPLVEKYEAYFNRLETAMGNVFVGQFYWGGTLLKCNAGTQRLAFHQWKRWIKA